VGKVLVFRCDQFRAEVDFGGDDARVQTAAHLPAALHDGTPLPLPLAAAGGQAHDVFDARVGGSGDRSWRHRALWIR